LLIGVGSRSSQISLPNDFFHLIVSGDTGSGKTTTLRTLIRSITEKYTADEAQLVVIDSTMSLLGEANLLRNKEYLYPNGYLSVHDQESEIVTAIEKISQSRDPRKHQEITPKMLRERSWFDGPEIFVIVDDYHLHDLGAAVSNIASSLASGIENGVHLIVSVSAEYLNTKVDVDKLLVGLIPRRASVFLLSGSPKMVNKPYRFSVRNPGQGQLITPPSTVAMLQVFHTPPAE
jgi:S-DNA-T family DNA segregation ATPase FtsK/SpoIIIE